VKGGYLAKAEEVTAATPASLNAYPTDVPLNRLGLAKWIASSDNPLTARVAVNRIWEQIFGRGIVETSEDFGTQGARPTHPDLLDWLATEFVRLGWSQKKLIKTIVMSNTYRQSSVVKPALLEKDPDNRLLARGPRFRMDAEVLRDSMLEASGLLNHKVGGPSVFPSQPDGVWSIPYNGDKWMESAGTDKFRRGIYTFLRRTSPYPEFLTFDSTSRESCTVRRIRTNTPLQALALLNDTVSMDASRAMGHKLSAMTSVPIEIRMQLAYRMVTSRPANTDEIRVLIRFYNNALKKFEANPASASSLMILSSGNLLEQAAWTMVSNLLLNLDEAITKD
ncbi:MAG: DUF1553 domain-containing protein, partial [Chthonomonadales bacterium]